MNSSTVIIVKLQNVWMILVVMVYKACWFGAPHVANISYYMISWVFVSCRFCLKGFVPQFNLLKKRTVTHRYVLICLFWQFPKFMAHAVGVFFPVFRTGCLPNIISYFYFPTLFPFSRCYYFKLVDYSGREKKNVGFCLVALVGAA